MSQDHLWSPTIAETSCVEDCQSCWCSQEQATPDMGEVDGTPRWGQTQGYPGKHLCSVKKKSDAEALAGIGLHVVTL